MTALLKNSLTALIHIALAASPATSAPAIPRQF